MNDSLLDELEKAEADQHDLYDPNAAYRPLLEEDRANSMKNRSKSAEDAEALWAELHSQPPQQGAPHMSPSNIYKFHSVPASNIRPPANQYHKNMSPMSSGILHPPKQPANIDVRRHLNLPSLADIKHNWFLTSRGRHVPDDAGYVENVDAFLIALYNYYYHNGAACYMGKEIVQLFNLLFTVCASSFLLGCVKWNELRNCPTSEGGCKRPFSDFISWHFDGNLFSTVVLFYFMIFFVFWVTRVVAFASNARDVWDMHGFYVEKLRIDAHQIQTMTWDEVVDRLLVLLPQANDRPSLTHHRSSYQLQVDPKALSTPLDIARRVMRKENYMIACMNSPLFQTELPSWVRLSSHVIFSRNMEFNLQMCVLDPMFSSTRPQSAEELKKRLTVAGIVNLLLIPFLLLFRTIQFFLVGAQEWSANRTMFLSSRRWSPLAMWTFREYNELPHVFDARVSKAYPLAEAYLGLFPTGLVSIIAGGVAFLAGSVMAILVFLSVVEESILLEIEVGSRQLIWYLTIAGWIFLLARSFQVSVRFTTGESYEEAMTKLAAETHHFPTVWRGQSHTFATRDALLALFPYKAVLFLEECASVLLAPYVLCVTLPENAHAIVRFLEEHTVTLPHVGAVCRFAEFDFKAYGGEPKMESSFMNFKRNHPTWTGPQEGEALVSQVSRFREQEMEKSLRLGDTLTPEAMSRTMMGESMFHSTVQLSLSHQLMQSQAIHMALGGPQSSEYYWLQKYHDRAVDHEEGKEEMDV
ncbi:hypothetical protein LEN26_005346 [Aphanomyces euteiches]|nr:hypothetical protein AeMF1_002972 [Aphanomyces euteiches]KAH9138345.1 hypothetical protein LEN26_005346 [Aphanomyces euteiches]KAH9189976.1 hypothetical protein AeNC1_008039 [Aphanomyces euteiches]